MLRDSYMAEGPDQITIFIFSLWNLICDSIDSWPFLQRRAESIELDPQGVQTFIPWPTEYKEITHTLEEELMPSPQETVTDVLGWDMAAGQTEPLGIMETKRWNSQIRHALTCLMPQTMILRKVRFDVSHSSHSKSTNWVLITARYKKKYPHSIITNLVYLEWGGSMYKCLWMANQCMQRLAPETSLMFIA